MRKSKARCALKPLLLEKLGESDASPVELDHMLELVVIVRKQTRPGNSRSRKSFT